jgi:hypothetical protein
MCSAHLSQFACTDPAAGARLIHQARARCARQGLAPALFVAVPAGDRAAYGALFENLPGVVPASATLYGTWPDLAAERWNISTAEI